MLSGMSIIETQGSPASVFRSCPEDLETARRVQTRMLRRAVPHMESLECAGCYLPAHGIGGDYCDLLDLGAGRVGIALGDISGKGVSAALMMASLQAILRSGCGTPFGNLASLLSTVNRLFWDCTSASDFATLFLGEYEDASGRLRYVNCGHLAPLLLRQDGSVERLVSTATILGAFESWSGFEPEVSLDPGDLLVLFTDGLTEAWNEREGEFGEARLIGLLEERRDTNLRELVNAVVSEVNHFSGGIPGDDLTLLIARHRGWPGIASPGEAQNP